MEPRNLPGVIQAMLDELPTIFHAARAELLRIKQTCIYTAPECEHDRWEEVYRVVLDHFVPAKYNSNIERVLKIWTGEIEI